MKITRSMLEPFPARLPGTPQQWIEIAEAYECEPKKRTRRQSGITLLGLCYASAAMTGRNIGLSFSSWKCKANHRRRLLWWKLGRRYADINRAQVARLIAAELRRRKKAEAK